MRAIVARMGGGLLGGLCLVAVGAPLLAAQDTALIPMATPAQPAAHERVSVVSDWMHRHVLFHEPRGAAARPAMEMAAQSDPRRMQNWYLRHQEVWWPEARKIRRQHPHRDWSVPLTSNPSVMESAFEPQFNFSYSLGADTGNGYLGTTDNTANTAGTYLATSGAINVTNTADGQYTGTYPLYPGGPAPTKSPTNFFTFDNVLYPGTSEPLDNYGLLFTGTGLEMNIFNKTNTLYEFDDFSVEGNTNIATGPPMTLAGAPGFGQTTPAKFVFDVTALPSCSNDYVVIGIPTTPASGGQANIVGVNNLYSGGTGAYCSTGPTTMFAYASGTGQVPAPVVISQNGTQLAYVENLPSGSSYFHVLTLGTSGTNGSSPTAAVVPGATGGNNAVDQTVLLSPNGTTSQSCTTAPWVVYTKGDANDFAFVTTYDALTGTGYLYKLTNIFNGSAPTIVWSLLVNAIPSTPVYDAVSNKVFFTDSNGRVDYVVNTNTSPSVAYGQVLANGASSENPVVVDSNNQMVYATFNTDGLNALVVQSPTTLASEVSVPVGTGSGVYSSPYEPDFNNDFYTSSGTPELYIAGTNSEAVPMLYSVGFNASGVLNSTADVTSAALATGIADSSPVTEFFNPDLGKDYLFVGVTNNCVATTTGGTGGCVMSLDITSGFPTVNAGTTALVAAGGTTGIIVDNDSGFSEASSIYFATKTGVTLVKATQSGLN
jgi:hypothetical protein